MPKALMKFALTDTTRVKSPAVDFHLHGRSLQTAADYQKMIALTKKRGSPAVQGGEG